MPRRRSDRAGAARGPSRAVLRRQYDARHPKTDYEHARLNLSLAIAEAQRLGLAEDVLRLTRRRDHVQAVYDSQFRFFY